MSTKTIKDVDEKTWRKLKMLSAEENVKMGKLIGIIADTYVKSRTDIWSEILSGKKILSDSEAKEIEKVVKKLRKERGFR